MAKKYVVDLTPCERDPLIQLTRKGKVKARKLKRAQILLLAKAIRRENLLKRTDFRVQKN